MFSFLLNQERGTRDKSYVKLQKAPYFSADLSILSVLRVVKKLPVKLVNVIIRRLMARFGAKNN